MKILVTGGAGYIGAHLVHELERAGHQVWVVDNLSNSRRRQWAHAQLWVRDFADEGFVREILRENEIQAVFHLAAKISVAESYAYPELYELTNVQKTKKLLQFCGEEGVQHFIFSSTAALYADGETPYGESSEIAPVSPYAQSKASAEEWIKLKAPKYGVNYLIFRSFNIAGAHQKALFGQDSPNSTHLIKVACEAALKKRPYLPLYGEAHPTPDGTCIRDYLHVEDLVQAYLLGLHHLAASRPSEVLNCGAGRGFSVKEVIDFFHQNLGHSFEVLKRPARKGDVSKLVASNKKINHVLGWRPRRSDLDSIIKSALKWEAQL